MTRPVIMGALMGPMMMWMLHGAVTGSGVSGWALVAFVAAHVILGGAALALVIFGARMSPKVRGWVSRLHRPSFSHIGAMVLSAAVVAGSIHLVAHGFEGVSWI